MKNSSKTPTFVDQNKIYHMKRTLLLIFTLLTVTLAAVAQPRISSNKETHNFGQIEWKKPVTVENGLYQTWQKPVYEGKELRFIPYYAWANRGEGEMEVWVNQL